MRTRDDIFLGISNFEKTARICEQIVPGMLRCHVEIMLGTRRVDRVDTSLTGWGLKTSIYEPHPGLRVEICFDDHGGPGLPFNRVQGEVRIYHRVV